MIKLTQQMSSLISTLQALTLQRINALRLGKTSEAQQIESIQVEIDNKIQRIEQSIRLIKS
jgi:predicted transcriptional regulator